MSLKDCVPKKEEQVNAGYMKVKLKQTQRRRLVKYHKDTGKSFKEIFNEALTVFFNKMDGRND